VTLLISRCERIKEGPRPDAIDLQSLGEREPNIKENLIEEFEYFPHPVPIGRHAPPGARRLS
jgi:hypothetical protein